MKTKQEWIDAARAEGVKLKGRWVDDWIENTVIAFVFAWIGYILHGIIDLFK